MPGVKWFSVLTLAAIVHSASAATIGAISITVNADNVLNYDFTYQPILNRFSDTRNQVLGGVNGDVSFNLVSIGDPDDPLVRQTGTITNLSSIAHSYTIQVGIPLGFPPDPDSSTLGPFRRAISSIAGNLTDGGADGAATSATLMGFNDLLPPGPSLNVGAVAACSAPVAGSVFCNAVKVTDFAPAVFEHLSLQLKFTLGPSDSFSYESFVQLTNVPEPSSCLMLFGGLVGLSFLRGRKWF